jgi:phage minor structural protein
MSYPILYSATETNFDHNGFGILGDCVSCEVTEEANGIFELTMQYPMDGIHFENISDRSIIKAKADQFREPQLFRIYSINKPMSGVVAVLAEHISYDLSGIPVSRFSAENVNSALSGLRENAITDCPFTFWTNMNTIAKFDHKIPASIRSKLGGSAGSILDVYGGELEFDNYTVKLHNNRGMNRGVSIRYGKNLTDIDQERNCASVVTGIYPYWAGEVDGDTVLVELPEKIVNAPGTYNFEKIKTIDFTSYFETQPSVEQLRTAAEKYVKSNNVGVPKVSMKISFAQLEQTEEYKHLKLLERVALFDTVNVEFPALGVSATAKAVKMVYDVLADRVKSVTLGSVRSNIADTIAAQQQEIDRKPSKTFMELAIESLTKTILGAKGGSVRFLDENGDGEPDTLYIADNTDPEQAVKVWRFNYEGWGASKNGYNGPFEMGATFKDGIIADFITAGTLNAALVKSGVLSSVDGKAFFDLENSKIVVKDDYGIRSEMSSGVFAT